MQILTHMFSYFDLTSVFRQKNICLLSKNLRDVRSETKEHLQWNLMKIKKTHTKMQEAIEQQHSNSFHSTII